MHGWLNRLLTAAVELPCDLMLLVVKGYRLLLKPALGNACRFEPTCSQYALTALERHGALVGGTLAAGRLMRCHPWCAGGCDEVPAKPPFLFTRLGLVGATGAACTESTHTSNLVSPAAEGQRGKSSEPSPSPVQEPAP